MLVTHDPEPDIGRTEIRRAALSATEMCYPFGRKDGSAGQ